jgi:hypothetical protein
MRAVLLGNDFIELENGDFKFLEINTNTTFEFGFEDYVDFQNLFTFMSDNGLIKLTLVSSSSVFWNHILPFAEENGIELTNIPINANANFIPDIEDDSETLVLRIAYDGTALVDSDYAANKTEFYNLIKDEEFAIKTYFKGDTISEFVESHNNFPNYIVKGNIPNLNGYIYPKYYKLNTIEEVQNLINTLEDKEMLCEFHLSSAKIDNQLCTIRSLDVLFSDLTTINIGSYYKSMYFSKEEIGEFEYDSDGLLYDRFRYALTNDLTPYLKYSGDNTDTLLLADGTSIPYSEISTDVEIQSIAITNLPEESDNIMSYMNWVTTDKDLMDNSSLSTSQIKSFNYKVVNDWLFKIVLNNGFEWNDSFFTKLLIKKSSGTEIKFRSVQELEIGDTIYFWNSETNEYVSNIVLLANPIWVENQILYNIDVSPNDVYLTSAYDTIKFVQHNFQEIDSCSCCTLYGYLNCGAYCCALSCFECTKQIN